MADGSHGFDPVVEVPQGLSWCSDDNPGLTRRRPRRATAEPRPQLAGDNIPLIP